MIKYNYSRMIDENMNNRGQFINGKLFDLIGAESIRFEKGHKARISFSAHFPKENCTRGRRSTDVYYDITISQNGAELEIMHIIGQKAKFLEFLVKTVNQAVPKLMEVWKELDKFKFEPDRYEIYGDNPETPYYLAPGERAYATIVLPVTCVDDDHCAEEVTT